MIVHTDSNWVSKLWKSKDSNRKDVRHDAESPWGKATMSVREMKKETKGSTTVPIHLKDTSTLDRIESPEYKSCVKPIISMAGVAITADVARRYINKDLTNEDLIYVAGNASFSHDLVGTRNVVVTSSPGATEDEAFKILTDALSDG